MGWESPMEAIPWVGLYVCLASLVCIIGMAADVFQGFRKWKLWFPNRFFTLNTASITLIGIAMKLPLDLNVDLESLNGDFDAKLYSIFFLVTMLANFLPSLGLMDDRELLLNMVAWGILIVTFTVNIWIQIIGGLFSKVVIIVVIFPLLWVFSVALTVPASRRILEHRYKELHGSDFNQKEINFSYKELRNNVIKYWMMAETVFVEKVQKGTKRIGHGCEIRDGRIYELSQIEDDAKLSERVLKNAVKSITQLLHVSEKKWPRNLMKLLQKSTGFNGVVEFDSEQVPTLTSEETQNSWSLVTLTLTAIAVALPNIAEDHVKGFLVGMNEGLQIVKHVEESLNACDELVKVRRASRRVGTDVEVYRKWLHIDLQKARKGKTSKEILHWLGDEAGKIVREFNNRKNVSLDHSFHKFIAANSMYRITQTLLLQYYHQEIWPTDMEVFEQVLTIIADILYACFTNLPRVINMKCHHDAIEKRPDSIRTAAQILGKSKTIFIILESRQLPNLDMDSMAYLDKWHALPKSQIPNDGASASSNSKESLGVTIM